MAVSDYEFNKLRREVEELRNLVSGASSVPDPLEVDEIVAVKNITIGETTLPILYFKSNANAGDSGYIFAFKETGGDMMLQFSNFDKIVAPDGTNLWP